MSELKPCPFCGGEAKLMEEDDGVLIPWIICRGCGCETAYFETTEKAIESWNRRKENTPAVNAVPVVHGHWIFQPGLVPCCSECGQYSDDAWMMRGNYCSSCGAKMDGGRITDDELKSEEET